MESSMSNNDPLESLGLCYFVSKADKKVMDVTGSNTSDCTKIISYPKNEPESLNQQWTFKRADVNTYLIRSALNEKKVIDIEAGSHADGANAIIYSCHGGKNQQYFVLQDPGPGGYSVFLSCVSGKALTADGGKIVQKTFTGKDDQMWLIDGDYHGVPVVPQAKPMPEFMKKRKCDIAIIGAGFAGAYCAYRIHARHPDKTIAMFEARNRVGGRLLSYESPDPRVEDELGGMRIFPKTQKNLAKLLKHLELDDDLTAVSLEDKDNYFYSLGVQNVKGEYKYKGRDGTASTISELENKAWEEFKKRHPHEKVDGEEAWNSKILRKLSFDDFYRRYGLDRKELSQVKAWSGYDLYPEHVSVAVYRAHSKLYGSDPTDQKYIKFGYNAIVRALIDEMDEEKEFFLKFGARCTAVQKDEKDETKDPDRKKLILLFSEEAEPFYADKVIITTTMLDLKKIRLDGAINKNRMLAFDAIATLPLFKCFIHWENPWWTQQCGKTTTDLPLRQVHYYSEGTLLVYNSGPYAEFWNSKFEEDMEDAIEAMIEMVAEVHGKGRKEIDKPKYYRWKFWIDGSHKWAKRVDAKSSLAKICHGGKKYRHENVFMCGDTYSLEQGWVEGAIESSEGVLSVPEDKGGFGLKEWLEADEEESKKMIPNAKKIQLRTMKQFNRREFRAKKRRGKK